MKKINHLLLLSIGVLALVGCRNNATPTNPTVPTEPTEQQPSKPEKTPSEDANTNVETLTTEIINGGFETGDLSGWTVLSGNAFTNDSVSSRKTFSYSYDANHNEIGINHTGNWYLSGKGFDLSYSNNRTGVIKSSNFYLTEDGMLSMKIAGGALKVGKWQDAADKAKECLCYVGVYRASDDMMIAQQKNEYFLEHTEDYVDPRKYAANVYSTDNFYEYTLDLSEYIGEELYIKVIDNDTSVYYGYISVDDIKIGYDDEGQMPGTYYTKVRDYVEEVEAPSQYEIANGDFETGSLAGWEIISGNAFSNSGVNPESVWWNENITYSRDGNYHYGHYNPSGVGVMRSSSFILGGSGYITFKLGGCSNNHETYLRVMLQNDSGDYEVARYSNYKYWNFQFPYVENGMRLLNMNQYYADLSQYLGQTLYIEVVDNNASGDDLGCITLDSIQTYWEEKPVWYTSLAYKAISSLNVDVEIESVYQVENGSFETGDLTGWTYEFEDENMPIGVVSNASTWWIEALPYNKKGDYLFTGADHERGKGYLLSSEFEIGGLGYITFLLGGGKNPKDCYIAIVDSTTGEEIARYYNELYIDNGIGLINRGSNMMNMVQYKADLSEYIGKKVQIKVVDNASSDWGLVAIDSFTTYYEDINSLPEGAYLVSNILENVNPTESNYQVLNGGFETGDLTGWTLSGGNIANISSATIWWHESYLFDKTGTYFLNGWSGNEGDIGNITSSAFEIGGSGYITFKLGGAKNPELCNIEIIDATTNEVLARFGNELYRDLNRTYPSDGRIKDLSADGYYLANMVLYKADLSNYIGRTVKIRINDQATNDWGLVFCDDFVTYYADATTINEKAILAKNLI